MTRSMPLTGVPSDNTTLVEVLDQLDHLGYPDQLLVTDDNHAMCVECGQRNDPRDVIVHGIRRLEGASDPADMIVVIAAICPTCGCGGTLVMGYGPNASRVEREVQGALRDGRDVCDLR